MLDSWRTPIGEIASVRQRQVATVRALVYVLLACAVMAIGYVTDESACLWRALLGVPCPGCGMTHALLALARCDWRAAWQFNPGSFAVAPLLVSTGIAHLTSKVRRA